MESTKEFQLLYLQKLFDKYANIIDNKVILNLSVFNLNQQYIIHIMLLQFGIISLLENNQLIIDKYIINFKNLINFSNKKQELLNNINIIKEINDNDYIYLPIIDKQLIDDQETYQLLINNKDNLYIANGFIVKGVN